MLSRLRASGQELGQWFGGPPFLVGQTSREAAISEGRDRDDVVEYVLMGGRRGSISVAFIRHVTVLSDGRGVIYTSSGNIIVVVDGLNIHDRWLRER